MSQPVSTAVLVRLSQVIALANPEKDDDWVIARAHAMLESLRSAGLDIVFSTWVEDPASAFGGADRSWDPFIEGMRMTLRNLGDRKPWRGDS